MAGSNVNCPRIPLRAEPQPQAHPVVLFGFSITNLSITHSHPFPEGYLRVQGISFIFP